MMHRIRPLVLAVAFGAALGWIGAGTPPDAAAQSCDPSYPFVCLPPGLGITCLDIGVPIVVIHDPNIGANDPYFLDPDFNGVGCEGF